MKVRVTPLRRMGRRIEQRRRPPPITGDLVVMVAPVTDGRARLQAVIQSGKTSGGLAQTVLGPLLDPALVAAGESALLLLGTDDENGGEVVQEWWVRMGS